MSMTRIKRVTTSDTEQTRHYQWRLCVNASLSVTSLLKRVNAVVSLLKTSLVACLLKYEFLITINTRADR
jgi:hypothetical protein